MAGPLLREDIIDPAEPLIDAHHHLWNKPGQPYLLNEYLTDANTVTTFAPPYLSSVAPTTAGTVRSL